MSDSIKKWFEMQTEKKKTHGFLIQYPFDLDVMLDIEGVYEKGEAATYDYPGSASELSIESIQLDGKEIYDLVSDYHIEEISETLRQEFDETN